VHKEVIGKVIVIGSKSHQLEQGQSGFHFSCLLIIFKYHQMLTVIINS